MANLFSERPPRTRGDSHARRRRQPEIRRPDRTEAILDATHELLGEVGYERLTIDAVAARAHASKSTIYRRWKTKQELVTSAFKRESTARLPITTDAGTLRDDLIALLRLLREVTTPRDARAFVSLLAASQQEPQIAEVMRTELDEPWRLECERIIQRARKRGELTRQTERPSADVIFDLIVGQVMVRTLLRGEAIDDSFLVHVVDAILVPVLQGGSA